jgi:hypothetical protein
MGFSFRLPTLAPKREPVKFIEKLDSEEEINDRILV